MGDGPWVLWCVPGDSTQPAQRLAQRMLAVAYPQARWSMIARWRLSVRFSEAQYPSSVSNHAPARSLNLGNAQSGRIHPIGQESYRGTASAPLAARCGVSQSLRAGRAEAPMLLNAMASTNSTVLLANRIASSLSIPDATLCRPRNPPLLVLLAGEAKGRGGYQRCSREAAPSPYCSLQRRPSGLRNVPRSTVLAMSGAEG
jgi:hypothetical protein